MNRSNSPDAMLSGMLRRRLLERESTCKTYVNDLVSSPKRFANENRSNPVSNHRATESSITRRPATTHAGIDR